MRDPALPAAGDLLGMGARDIVRPAVLAARGSLDEFRAEQVLYQPGVELTVRYSARVRWGCDERRETLMACHRPGTPPLGTLVVESDDALVGVWRYPFDPVLEVLADAVHPERAREFVPDAGEQPLVTRVRAYRPMQRAVVEVTGSDCHVFLKLVAPEHVDPLVEAHECFAGYLPVPDVVRVDPRGVLTLHALPGESLSSRLRARATPAPDAGSLHDLATSIAAIPFEQPRDRSSLAWRHHVELLRHVLPGTERLLDEIAAGIEDLHVEGWVTSHGDLHPGQVLVDHRGDITGLLDLDRSGIGTEVDDLAVMLAHLYMCARGAASSHASLRTLAWRFELAAATTVDGDALRRATAAVMVGLATGPFRVQQRRWPVETKARLHMARALLGSRRHQ